MYIDKSACNMTRMRRFEIEERVKKGVRAAAL